MRPGEPPRYRRELDDETIRRASLVCAVLKAQAIKDGQGDLSEPVEKGLIGWDDVIERALESLGLSRRVGLTAPSFLAALHVVADTDFFFAAPRAPALAAGRRLGFDFAPLGIAFETSMPMTPLAEAVRDYVQGYMVTGKKLGD